MSLKSMREAFSVLLLAALLCTLPMAAGAAPTTEEESAPAGWWQAVERQVAGWLGAWLAPEAPWRGEQRLRAAAPEPEPAPPTLSVVSSPDGSTGPCPGEGGPGWDPNGCN